MLALADFGADQGGNIYPSIPTIAAKIRMSERQTKRIIHELIDSDFLQQISPETPAGRNIRNRYQVNLQKVTSCHPLVNKRVTNPTERVTPRVIKGDAISPESKRGSQSSGEPLEPLYNRKVVEKLDQLRKWIKQLKNYLEKNPNDEQTTLELERASFELAEYEKSLNQTGTALAGGQ